ncbi:MAG: hypothetical protein GYA58_14755 [Anaerolineaceae bacterium]|nr:hypothetical protein [Anaerolineaceae bacterium]
MNKTRIIPLLTLLALTLAACQPGTPTPATVTQASLPTVEIITATSQPTVEQLPTITPEAQATAAPTTTVAATGGNLADTSSSNYLDDRSTPAALMLSYVNAINRHEYLRAYSYWVNPTPSLGDFDAFTNSFSGVGTESVVIGNISADGAAGSIYYTLPVLYTDTLANSGTTLKYVSCVVMRLPQPANYGEPPIQPLNFDSGTKAALNASISDADALAAACNGQGSGGPTSAPVLENLTDLSANNYIDNRSGAVEVVSSLLNAINRKEYVRAYSYWQNPSQTVGNYDNYAAGYNDTGSVSAVFGTVISDAGAGQFHYQVPVGMIVTTNNNTQQTFIGCYTLHLANPGMQGTLPFEPLGITAGKFKQISNGTSLSPLLATACN